MQLNNTLGENKYVIPMILYYQYFVGYRWVSLGIFQDSNISTWDCLLMLGTFLFLFCGPHDIIIVSINYLLLDIHQRCNNFFSFFWLNHTCFVKYGSEMYPNGSSTLCYSSRLVHAVSQTLKFGWWKNRQCQEKDILLSVEILLVG